MKSFVCVAFAAALFVAVSGDLVALDSDVKLMQSSGSVSYDFELILTAGSCDETVKGVTVTGVDSSILDTSTATVEVADINGGDCVDALQVNVTVSATFDLMVGTTPMSITATTVNGADELVKYTTDVDVAVYGITLYKGDAIVSENTPFPLGTAYDVAASPTMTFDVITSCPGGSCPESEGLICKVVDNQKIVNYDTSCPTVTDDITEESGMCNMGFSPSLDTFTMELNPYRVGCGVLSIECVYEGLSYDGVEWENVISFEFDMDVMPPAVIDVCSFDPLDYYGYSMSVVPGYNFVMCGQEAPNKLDVSLQMGDAAFDLFTMRNTGSDQTLSLVAPAFLDTGLKKANTSVTPGSMTEHGADGDVTTPVVFICEGVPKDEVDATFGSSALATLDDTPEAPEASVAMEASFEFMATEVSKLRKETLLGFLNVDAALTGLSSGATSRRAVEQCDSMMCSLRSAVSRVSNLGVSREDPMVITTFTIVVPEAQANAVLELNEVTSEQLAAEAALVGGSVSVGAVAGAGVGAAGGITAGVTAVIAVGAVGLLLLVVAIVYVVKVQGDEDSTASDWTQEGVSVEGVPIPSDRYFDNVVVDDYGRGNGPANLRVEQPGSQ